MKKRVFEMKSSWIKLAAVLAIFVAFNSPIPDVSTANASGWTTEAASVAIGGGEPNGYSFAPKISADGRFVTFVSGATNLVEGDTNRREDIFVFDRESGRTERVSISSDGMQADQDCRNPAIGGDGRYVVFISNATNLVSGDTNGCSDVFLRDRQAGTTERVSVNNSGVQGNGDSGQPSVSSDGRYVAFSSDATNLVVQVDDNFKRDIFVRDRETGRTERISVSSAGRLGNGTSDCPSISADGRFVAFESRADNLVAGDTNGYCDVFVRDRWNGLTERVSIGSSGEQGNGDSLYPAVSADGRYVAYISYATNLVGDDTNGCSDVFVYDRETRRTERVSDGSAGGEGNGNCYYASISGDGRYVAFESLADNLVEGDTNGGSDVFVHDRRTHRTVRVSLDGNGCQLNGTSKTASISLKGDLVAFEFRSPPQPGKILVAGCLPDANPPVWPDGSSLTAVNIGQTAVTLTWTQAEDDLGVTCYRIYNSSSGEDLLLATVTGLVYEVTGLNPGTGYTFRIDAGDAAGNWSAGPSVAVTTYSDGALTDAEAVAVDMAALTFDAIRGANDAENNITSDLNLPVCGVNGSTITWLSSDTTIIDASGVVNRPAGGQPDREVILTAAVTRGDACATVSFHLVVKALQEIPPEPPDTEPPVWPEGSALTVSRLSRTGLTLNWKDAADNFGVTGYKVFQEDRLLAVVSGGTTSLRVTGLAPGTTYCFGVEAGDAAGNWSAGGPTVTVTTAYDSGGGSARLTGDHPVVTALDILKAVGTACEVHFTAEQAAAGVAVNGGALAQMVALNRRLVIATPGGVLTLTPDLAGALVGERKGDLVLRLAPAGEAAPPPEHLQQRSELIGIKIETAGGSELAGELRGKIRLDLPYEPDQVRDARRVSVFGRADDGWHCLGGVADGDNRIGVSLRPFSCFALFEDSRSFTDLDGHWAREEIETVASRGVLTGLPGGSFEPDRGMTRAETAAALANVLELAGMDVETGTSGFGAGFKDVPPGSWYAGAVARLAGCGLACGLPGGFFGPERIVSREEMGVLAVRVLRLLNPGSRAGDYAAALKSFRDAGSVSPWAEQELGQAVALGLIRGTPENGLNPAGEVTRAQAAAVIKRLLAAAGLA